jgi:hypothetical protein
VKLAFTDTRLEEQEIVVGESRREAEAEIARLEKEKPDYDSRISPKRLARSNQQQQ